MQTPEGEKQSAPNDSGRGGRMEPVVFRHGDICWKMVRRQTLEYLTETLASFTVAMFTRGRSLLWPVPEEEELRYRSALCRLRRAGMIVRPGRTAQLPHIRSEAVETIVRRWPALRPERRWSRRWNGTWWLLCYDVPEARRDYRDQLRFFVRRLGLGRLQESVYITPDDIRAEYDDLARTASAGAVSVLLASRSTLGRPDGDLSRLAWNMDRLRLRQSAFLRTGAAIRKKALQGEFDAATLRQVREEAFLVYLDVMRTDPLLPRAAWPRGYLGPEVYAMHRGLQRELLRSLPAGRSRRRTARRGAAGGAAPADTRPPASPVSPPLSAAYLLQKTSRP